MSTMRSHIRTSAASLLVPLALMTFGSGCGGPAADGMDALPSEADVGEGEQVATIEYLAHASFLIRSPGGAEILVDPYASRVWIGYDFPPGVEPDAILITHPHYDHDAGRYRGQPFPWGPEVQVIDAPGVYQIDDISVTAVEGKHADPYGKEFGQLNTLMRIEVAGLRIVHLGDNGPLSPESVAALGPVDILMAPADETYHILSEAELQTIRDVLRPRILIPMHYRIPTLEPEAGQPRDLGDLEPWLEGRVGVDRVGGSVAEISAGDLPAEERILVFEHSGRMGSGGG